MISTIILNWNRAELLEQTLRSFAETTDEPFELTVVDNASTDRSRAVIEEARGFIPGLQTIFHDENQGGEALNGAIERATGELIHLNENDIVLLPGWRDHVRETFRAFSSLGQLSLFSGVPTDDYPGEPQPATLRFASGKIVYEAHGSLGSSSILRAALFREHGIRVRNVPQRDADAFKFPDDARLSADVKEHGYWCAWSDRLYIRNLGHHPEEFDRDPGYYERNYSSKPWIGTAGWYERVAAAREQPRPRRYSAVFGQLDVQPERTAGDCAGVKARLWSMLDGGTPEVEVLDFLHALVRLVKPRRAFDTSAWLGRGAVAIGSALRDNGFGKLQVLARDDGAAAFATATIAAAGLRELVTTGGPDAGSAATEEFDFAFFGSRTSGELARWYDALGDGATLVFHGHGDAPAGAGSIETLASAGLIQGFAPNVPRGLFVGTLAKPPDGFLRRVPDGFDVKAYLDTNPDVARAGVDGAEHYRRVGWREGRSLGAPGTVHVDESAEDRDSYESWRSSYTTSCDWDATYRRGQWDYLDEMGEVPRYAVVAGYVHKLLTRGHVLDAGCGEAILGSYLDLERFDYTGIDVSPTAVARARMRLRRGSACVSSIESFDVHANTRYAAVVFNESIQLTETPLESIDRYRASLAAGGIIVVSLFVDPRGRGPRLGRLLAAECATGRYALIDRSTVASVSHALSWEIFVLR